MITPTRLAIWATAAGAPFALLVGVFLPSSWYAGLAWPAAVLLLTLADTLIGPSPRQAALRVTMPRTAPVGGDADATIEVTIAGQSAPGWCEVALDHDPLSGRIPQGFCGSNFGGYGNGLDRRQL